MAAVTDAPLIFILALGVGVVIGWLAAWLVLNQRLVHHKELVEHYEKAARLETQNTARREGERER